MRTLLSAGSTGDGTWTAITKNFAASDMIGPLVDDAREAWNLEKAQ